MLVVPTRFLTILSVNNSVGGINPMMCASSAGGNGGACFNVSRAGTQIITSSVCVGNRCIEPTQSSIVGVTTGGVGTAITLNVPSYKMSSLIEQSYLADPIRSCTYLDHYFFTIPNVAHDSTINTLLSYFLQEVLVLKLLWRLPHRNAADRNL